MKRRVMALAMCLAMAASMAACGSGGQKSTSAAGKTETAGAAATAASPDNNGADISKAEYTITIGHINAESDSWHQASLDFKDQVEKNSDGRIKVEVYPNSQLGSEIDMIQSILQQGGCDITFTGESMQTYNPDLGIVGMPYLIQSDEHMTAVLEGQPGKELEKLMNETGMEVLGYFTRGPRYITSNKEIKGVDDCKNLIIRTPQSPMTVAAFTAIGAKPTPMALNEVFTSLQSGTIEAQENPLAMIQTQSFYEVQRYLIRTAHLRSWVYIAMGKAQFDALPEDLRKVVKDAGKHCQDYEHELFLKNEEEYEKKLQEEGMTFVDVDQKEFSEKMIGAVVPTLTSSQKKLYDEIEALNSNK